MSRLYLENCTALHSTALKGTVTQNIFSLKSGPEGYKGLGNDNDLQKKIEIKRKQLNLMIFFGP